MLYGSIGATKYAAWNGTAWSFQTLPYGDVTSLAIDSHDHSHVTFGVVDGSSLILTYGMDNGFGFVTTSLSGPDMGGQQISLALDPLGLPHITSSKIVANNKNLLRYSRLTLPEITGSFQNISRTSGPSGDDVVCDFQVSNSGNSKTISQTVRVFLSNDLVVDGGDTLVVEEKVGAIAPGKTTSVRFKNTFPNSVSGKYLIALVDGTNRNPEIEELNNASAGVIP